MALIALAGIILAAAPAPVPAKPAAVAIALPGGPPVSMDYLAYDPATNRVWVPAGNTGKVDVIDASDHKVTAVEGFPTGKRGERVVGPSSASVGPGFVYVGNRGDSSVCAIHSTSLERGGCVVLDSMPDGVCYLAGSKEIWVTTPRDNSIAVLDASDPAHPKKKARIGLPGSPEGYAVDELHGLFFTNLEDQDRTLAIEVKSRQVRSTWRPDCGPAGPRGLAIDVPRGALFVACTDHAVAMELGSGKVMGQVPTGAGVDNIDYLAATHRLYVAAGKAAKLTVASFERGALAPVLTADTAQGARVVVVDCQGNAFLADSAGGRILEIPAAP